MAMNRVQFQPGLSMAEFMSRYGSDEQCEAALVESRWPTGFVCPSCGCGHSSSFRREGRLYFQCTACRHQCSDVRQDERIELAADHIDRTVGIGVLVGQHSPAQRTHRQWRPAAAHVIDPSKARLVLEHQLDRVRPYPGGDGLG